MRMGRTDDKRAVFFLYILDGWLSFSRNALHSRRNSLMGMLHLHLSGLNEDDLLHSSIFCGFLRRQSGHNLKAC